LPGLASRAPCAPSGCPLRAGDRRARLPPAEPAPGPGPCCPIHPAGPAQPVMNQPVQPAASPDSRVVADELRKLAELRDAGVLTEAEFAAQKARLLGS
jgi:putative oligomerization/nucleic acid binding protein